MRLPPKIDGYEPFFSTELGRSYVGDSLALMSSLPDRSINLVVTSPPFALLAKKAYGNEDQARYNDWFCTYAAEIFRLLPDDGSFVLDTGGAWVKGQPTRSLYQYRLLIALCDQVGFHLAQDFYWHNPSSIPGPAEWVNVRRIRVKSSVNLVWWLSKSPWPKASNRSVLKPYSRDMNRLLVRGVREAVRPSGHVIKNNWKDRGGAIPSNMLEMGNNDANSTYVKGCRSAGLPIHPARFPPLLPRFFIDMCTHPRDLVLDPFAGSNVTGQEAERLDRRWLAFELCRDYLDGSRYRFGQAVPPAPTVDQVTAPKGREHS